MIDNKEYVFAPAKNYEALQKRATLKTKTEKAQLTISEARAHTKKMIRKWETKGK